MNNFKLRIDLAITLAEILVDLAGDSVGDEEADILFEESFKFYKDMLKGYDSCTLKVMKDNATTIIELNL